VIAGSLNRECSACRSLYHSTTFRLLTYSVSYDTAPSVLPLEATTIPLLQSVTDCLMEIDQEGDGGGRRGNLKERMPENGMEPTE
jgi:hypothetical protein